MRLIMEGDYDESAGIYLNLVTGAEGILTWDGRFDDGNRARIGIYIIKVEAVDKSTGQSVEWVKTAVLAEVLR